MDPQSVKGGGTVTGKVTLNDTTGGTVTLTTSDATVAAPAAGTVVVSGGSASATFTINTSSVGSDQKAVITGTLNGVAASAVVTVTSAPKLVLLSFSPRTVQGGGGHTSTGTVNLNGPALAGTTVTLTSTNSAKASVPASVPVTTGQTTATFTVTTSSVTGTTPVDILAMYNSVTVHAVLTLTSYAVENKAPVEPRWAELGGPVLTASLAPWREMGFSSSGYSAGVVRLRFVGELEDSAQGLEGVRSIEAASVPGPPKRNYLYSPEMSLLAESEMSTPRDQKVLYEYVWFNGHPVAQIDGQTVTHWTFTDHLGTPLIQTTASQAVWWRAEYEPYGRVWAYNPTGLVDQHQPLRLPGQEAEQFNLGMNGATERSYNVFRWYRGGWGRYAQADPIGIKSGYNLFLYSLDAPLNVTDPMGLCNSGRCQDCPDGSWYGTAVTGEASISLFGVVGAGGLVFTGVMTCPSNLLTNVPFATLCGAAGGGVALKAGPGWVKDNRLSKDWHKGRVGVGIGVGAAGFKCTGAPCREDLSGPESGTYYQLGPAWLFKEKGSGGVKCIGVGGGRK